MPPTRLPQCRTGSARASFLQDGELSSHFIGNTLIVAARERTAGALTQIAGIAYYDDIIVRTCSRWARRTR